MAVSATRSSRADPQRVLERLVGVMEAELDATVNGVVERIRGEIPEFRRLSTAALAGAVRGNVLRALAALREVRAPTEDELASAAAIGRQRAASRARGPGGGRLGSRARPGRRARTRRAGRR